MRRLILIALLAAGCSSVAPATDGGHFHDAGAPSSDAGPSACDQIALALAETRTDGCMPPCPWTCTPTLEALSWCLQRVYDGEDNDCDTLRLDLTACAQVESVGAPICVTP